MKKDVFRFAPSKRCIVCQKVFWNLRKNKQDQWIRKWTKVQWVRAKFCSHPCRWEYLKSIRGSAHHSYKPEKHTDEKILCACSCGTFIPKFSRTLRVRKFVLGHTQRGIKRPDMAAILTENRKHHKGKKHWNWKGGITPYNHRLRQSTRYTNWRNKVYQRDKWTCQNCGIKCRPKNIVAHHLQSFDHHPTLRYDIANGITLCRSCHKKNHSGIGILTRFECGKINAMKGNRRSPYGLTDLVRTTRHRPNSRPFSQ